MDRYSIGVILANTLETLCEESFLDSIDILLDIENYRYTDTEVVQGFANSYDIPYEQAEKQLNDLQEGLITHKELIRLNN